MGLKRNLVCTLVCMSFFSAPAIASSTGTDLDTAVAELKRSFAALDVRRVEHIRKHLKLGGQAESRFMSAYRTYLDEQTRLREMQLAGLQRFAEHMNDGSLDDEAAKKSLSRSLQLDRQRFDNQQAMMKQMRSILQPGQQLRLYQLELLFESQIRSAIMTQIPVAS